MTCGRDVPQGCLWIFESRWFAVEASERKKVMFIAQIGQPTFETRWISFENKHFWKTVLFHPKMVGIVS